MNDTTIQTITTAMTAQLPILLVGHTGTGKTTIIRELASENKKQLVRVSITGDTTVDDLIGKYELESGNTVWKDGVMTQAVRKGHWLVVDEVNMAGGDITAAMHSLLDDDKFLTIIQHDSEVVKAHKDFRLFATMNPSHASNYAGTKPNNSAFLSRFGVVLELNYLSPDNEEKLIKEKLPEASTATIALFVSMANSLRQSYNDQQLNYICSTRDILAAVQLTVNGMKPGNAFDAAVAAKAGDERTEVLKRAKQHVQEVAKLEMQFPDHQVSFITLQDSLATVKAEKAKNIAQEVARDTNKFRQEVANEYSKKLEELKKKEEKFLRDNNEMFAIREKACSELEKRLKTDRDGLIKEGRDQCKAEMLAQLGVKTND